MGGFFDYIITNKNPIMTMGFGVFGTIVQP